MDKKRLHPSSPLYQQQFEKEKKMNLNQLFGNDATADTVIFLSDDITHIVNCHKSAIIAIPFFQLAFSATESLAMLGTKATFTFFGSYMSLFAMIKYAYQFSIDECVLGSVEDLLKTYQECESYSYKSFLEAIWNKVLNMRTKDDYESSIDSDKTSKWKKTYTLTPAQRLLTLKFASMRHLPLIVHIRDTFCTYISNPLAQEMTFEDILWILKAQLISKIALDTPQYGTIIRSIDGIRAELVFNWLITRTTPVSQKLVEVLLGTIYMQKIDLASQYILYTQVYRPEFVPKMTTQLWQFVIQVLWIGITKP